MPGYLGLSWEKSPKKTGDIIITITMKNDRKLRNIRRKGKTRNSVAVIGLGYVGLPLAVMFVKAGFTVRGIDTNQKKISELLNCRSYIEDITDDDIKEMMSSGRFGASGNYEWIKKCDMVCICVPTPLDKNRQPDLSFVVNSTEKIAKYLRHGHIIVLESTTYPGTTEEIMLPILQKKRLKVGKDFYLAFSPERIDPGNKKFTLKDIPKVVGGVTPRCSKMVSSFYEKVFPSIHTVDSPKVAEMEKLLENVFRSVNIALVNELAMLCRKMKINIWDVIEAAKTKPYGFMPFYPGPGIGGHCIPLDPFYLSWKAKEYGMNTHFIELAGEVNASMPSYVVELVQSSLNDEGKSIKGAKILVLGAAYKKDINDCRESPSLKIIEELIQSNAVLSYNDPYVPSINICGKKLSSTKINYARLKSWDCIVIATDHSSYDYKKLISGSRLIVDTRNATGHVTHHSARIVKV
jgi:UDP-N-acetyl-D-glucosamine dehydrogenase